MTKIRVLMMITLFILTLAGCNLEAEAPLATPTPPQVSFNTPFPTSAPLPTTTLVPTTGAGGNCVLNTTLPTYIVKAGDTLYDIAVRSNTTIENLVAINCLANADQIFSGQTIYVTQLVDPASARYMLILPNDNGANGIRVGCNDSAVPINSGLELTGVAQNDIQTSLTALFTASQIPAPYTTSLPTGLTVNNVTVAGNLATITLTGNLIAAGTCADARIQGQILLTVFGYDTISQAFITINGQNMKKLFDTSGLVSTTDPYLANQWLP